MVKARESASGYNSASRAVAATLGVLTGVGSMEHGLLECLQGWRPTPGLLIYALAPGNSWTALKEGGEGALTLIPNFLLTGVVAMLLGAAMLVWAVWRIHLVHGPAGFLLLGVSSLLTGGGVAQVALILLTWGVSTRIGARLGFWRRVIPRRVRHMLARLWRGTLTAATVCFLLAVEVAVFGYVPGIKEATAIQHLCWAFVGGGLVLYCFSAVAGFAADVEARVRAE
jgi:hypothetical protein